MMETCPHREYLNIECWDGLGLLGCLECNAPFYRIRGEDWVEIPQVSSSVKKLCGLVGHQWYIANSSTRFCLCCYTLIHALDKFQDNHWGSVWHEVNLNDLVKRVINGERLYVVTEDMVYKEEVSASGK